MLTLPEGFAHGFVALEDRTEVVYKTAHYYAPASERCIIFNDAEIGIEWAQQGDYGSVWMREASPGDRRSAMPRYSLWNFAPCTLDRSSELG